MIDRLSKDRDKKRTCGDIISDQKNRWLIEKSDTFNLLQKLQQLLAKAAFNIRSKGSNRSELLSWQIFGQDETMKILGLWWNVDKYKTMFQNNISFTEKSVCTKQLSSVHDLCEFKVQSQSGLWFLSSLSGNRNSSGINFYHIKSKWCEIKQPYRHWITKIQSE